MTHLPLWEAPNQIRKALEAKGEDLMESGEEMLLKAKALEDGK